MGKGGRGAPKAAALDDDALLEQAMAQATLERAELAKQPPKPEPAKKKGKGKARAAAQQEAAKPAPGTVLTMQATLQKLDRVMCFSISRTLPDGKRDACPGLDGVVTFYLDQEDVKADFEAMKAADPEAKLSLDFVPLGRAFALTQGIMGLKAPGPTRLQFKRSTAAEVGDKGVPDYLREKMAGVGPFPLFYSEKLGSERFTPVFFDVADLKEFWATCGGDPKNPPEPTATDLRIVVARTLQELGSWEPLHYVPAKASEPLTRELNQRAEREALDREAFTRGQEKLKKAAEQVHEEDGDEPPALT